MARSSNRTLAGGYLRLRHPAGAGGLPLENAAAVTVRTEGAVYTVYASDLQGGLRLVTAYDRTGELYRGAALR